ncbi:hypothetical protein [Bacillus sp. JCM 19041]|uniref:hypothetical protein n=1 Tax=Bacillus sp. JCM 19041 TaxID=1460637 RepID=UPI0006D13D3E
MGKPTKGEIMIKEAHFLSVPQPLVRIKYSEWTDKGRVFTEKEFPVKLLGESQHIDVHQFLIEIAEKSKTLTD